MKKLALTFFLLPLVCFAVSAQEGAAPCPTVSVYGPTRVPAPDETIVFTAKVNGALKSNALTYQWQTSTGEIVEGQGTGQIKVKLGKLADISTTVEVTGFPAGCANIASESLQNDAGPPPRLVSETDECPRVAVTGPSAPVRPGDEIIFTADVSGLADKEPEYFWTVSGGKIDRGQGTPVIYVSAVELEKRSLTAQIEIKNFPQHCPNSASETAGIATGDPLALDDYEKFTFAKERARLQNAAVELRENSPALLLFLFTYAKKAELPALKKRMLKMQNYLTQDLKIPRNNLFFALPQPGKRYSTRIYLVPKDVVDSRADWQKIYH